MYLIANSAAKTKRSACNNSCRAGKWFQGEPPKRHFLAPKMSFSRFSSFDLCRGTLGSQDCFDNPEYLLLCRVAREPNENRKPEPSEPFFPETESGTGTAGTVFQEPKPEPEPSFPVKNVLKHRKKKKRPFCRGTAGTENRNRSNRSTPKP